MAVTTRRSARLSEKDEIRSRVSEKDEIDLIKDTPRTPRNKRVIDYDGNDDDLPATPSSAKRRKHVLSTPKRQTPAQDEYPATPPQTPTVYSTAKSIFQRSFLGSGIIGREKERDHLNAFLQPRIEKHTGGALYISGVPGTGKSALLNEMLKELSNNRDIHVASINCMTVDKPHDIYSLVYNSLVPEARALSHKEACRELEALVIKPRGRRISRVVVLDELDHILTKDQDILFKLFQLAFAKNTTLILIGISNALDLTDRFLPRLKSNSLVPTILAFQPYSAQEIAAILEKRLLSLSPGPPGTRAPLMHPAAIQLCARKTTANTGDLRKAFDICRRAIELVEEEVRTNVVTTPENLGGGAPGTPSKRAALRDSRNALATMSLAEAPIVTAMHVMKVCSQSFGGSAVARIKALNLQQKAILCVMVHLRATSAASGAAGGLTVKSVFDRYVQACAQDKMLGRLQHGEFLEVIGALEAAGLVSIPESVKGRGSGARGRGAGHSRITTTVRMLDIMNATNDTPVLRQLVKDISR